MTSHTAEMKGYFLLYAYQKARLWGTFDVLNSVLAEMKGRFGIVEVLESRLAEMKGGFGFLAARAGEMKGIHRVANDADERYELYRGVGAEPDPDTEAPWETFASLPHETAALDEWEFYYFILRKRNKFGVVSKNISSWMIVTHDEGAFANSPSAPDVILAVAGANGKMVVDAYYAYPKDGDDQATNWAVWFTSNGVNPDGNATPTYNETIIKADGVAKLHWESSEFGDGTTLKVLVRVRRFVVGEGWYPSDNATIYTVIADVDGPPTPDVKIALEKFAQLTALDEFYDEM